MLRKFRSYFRAKNRSHKRRTINIEPLEARQMLTGMPVISEFMASNGTKLFDEDGESSDWIEIFNPTPVRVSVQGWSLTDDPNDLTKWSFADTSIEWQNFLLVFASSKDRSEPASPLHTNFGLDRVGECLSGMPGRGQEKYRL